MCYSVPIKQMPFEWCIRHSLCTIMTFVTCLVYILFKTQYIHELTVWQCLKEILYITVNEADWFAFVLLWDELGHGQRWRFRFGKRELLGLSGFDWSFLDPTPTRYFKCKLLCENIDLRAPSKGQIDICFHSLPFGTTVIALKICSRTILTLAEGQSSVSPHGQRHRYYSTPLVSTW